jgi:hypothetical protein
MGCWLDHLDKWVKMVRDRVLKSSDPWWDRDVGMVEVLEIRVEEIFGLRNSHMDGEPVSVILNITLRNTRSL